MRNGWNWKYPLSYMYPAHTHYPAPGKMVFPQHWRPASNGVNSLDTEKSRDEMSHSVWHLRVDSTTHLIINNSCCILRVAGYIGNQNIDLDISGKYAMRDLVQKLPSGNPQRDVGTSDDTIAAVLATLNEVIKKHPEFSRWRLWVMSDDGCGGSFTQLLITVLDSQQMEDRSECCVQYTRGRKEG